MESESGLGVSVPLGDFLTAEDPVWVWDASDRRILWANQAGRDFWGVATLEALRARRFDARNRSARRMVSLAEQSDKEREWVETLTLAAASGRRAVKCYMQSLQIAGGRPGLLVKALGYADGRDLEAPADGGGGAPPRDAARGARSDQAALEAIAAALRKRAKTNAAERQTGPAAPHGAAPAPRLGSNALALNIRELFHELRNPLTVISGFAERIRDCAPPGKRQEQLRGYAGDILESAQLAMAILSDFTDRILRPEDDPPRPEPVELGVTVESCVRLIAPLAKQVGIKVYRSTPRNLPKLMAGERVVKQVLLNLLMNAVRHQKTGGKIAVTARRRKDSAIYLTVVDDGKGMTKKEIKAVLARSPRKDRQDARPANSGLGLPLVRRLVEGAGGQLSIESARGKGTTVGITFPALG